MTPQQKEIVQGTWAQVVPISDVAAQLFYSRLFEIAPQFRPLFPADMSEQRKKLMQMIAVAVAGLDRLDQIVPAVQSLGKRHAQYGVQEADYDVVGEALLWTLAQGLGPAFTPEAEASWAAVYQVLATTMKEAARKEEPRKAA